MKSETETFEKKFKELTGNPPLSWQRRLYDDFAKGCDHFPSVIDLPTGLGKTMVMAIWLIARTLHPELKLPTRLIYVVDRRTVVDQATDIATTLQIGDKARNLPGVGKENLAISTLRGQLADNREWSRNPAHPAIIIGTVDLIGSALLFSGYRSSYKQRPLEAGMLGQDSLLVLDEAHLSKPFEKLVTAVSRFQGHQVMPMKVISMSATTTQSDDIRFALIDSDLSDAIIRERFTARKALNVVTSEDVINTIATASDGLAKLHPGSRIVIFVKSPKEVTAVRNTLIKKDKSYVTKIAMLTGTMRGLERDELVDIKKSVGEQEDDRRVMQRFLKPDNDLSQGACFLISTSAGEVGFDLNADHLVGDAAPLDSWIQRLGRVNRRGKGNASIFLVLANDPSDKTEMEKACIAASKLFTDGMDVSPKALAAFKTTLTCDQLTTASTPAPMMVDLTDILLDAWSMTSIIEPMPGRPEVAPWLRGMADDLPQTTIAWRAELDLQGFDQLDLEIIEEWYDTHRVLAHETLSVPTSTAAKWFIDRWNKLDGEQKLEVGCRSTVIDRVGLKLVTVNEIINQLDRKNTDFIRNADLILPASFGGIERRKGLLDAGAPELPKVETTHSAEDHAKAVAGRRISPDVADERDRYRMVVTTTEGNIADNQAIGSGVETPSNSTKFAIELESDDIRRVQLVSYVPKRDKLEWGSTKQTLSQHVQLVRESVEDILSRTALPDATKRAAQLAAEYHDHGKNRERWQRTIGGTPTTGTTDWLTQFTLKSNGEGQCLGKSGGEMKRDSRGYRHEFGSLREFMDQRDSKRDSEIFDLAMHLIAVHHGRGRPHFAKGAFDPECESRSDEIQTESIRRFARLQRKHGWWHLAWLENLLRCADAMASSDPVAAMVNK